MSANALESVASESGNGLIPSSREEEDLLARRSKKIKNNEEEIYRE